MTPMDTTPNEPVPAPGDDAEFEASLVSDVDAGAAQVDDSGTLPLGPSGTLSATAPGVRQVKAPSPARTALPRALRTRWVQALLIGIGVLLAAGVVLWLQRGHGGTGPDRGAAQLAALARHFPDAPHTYGDRVPDTTGKPTPPNRAPAFSWVGKVDTTGLQFVASRRGQHAYRIDDPLAALIRAEDSLGYKTAADAAADGKTPLD